MKETLLDAAKKYLQKILATTDFEVNFEENNYDAGARDAVLDVTERAYVAGAKWQEKQSPWINIEDDFPNDFKQKLILLKNGQVRIAYLDSIDNSDTVVYFWCDEVSNKTFGLKDVVAYMPIPSFQ